MRDALAVMAVIAFFALGAAYVVACARILASTGDIDEELSGDADEQSFERAA
jgi:hypothetical protein